MAQTNWPGFQASLKPGLSTSPKKASLPTDVSITAPGPAVSKDKAAFSGIWHGWMCRNRVCDTKLAVEKITPLGATIVYAFASKRVNPYKTRLKAQWVSGELAGFLPRGRAHIAYAMRSDGNLNVMWRSADGSSWASGILTRQ